MYLFSPKLHSHLGCESCSTVSDSVTPQTIQFTEFFRPEYWSGQPFPSPGDLPNLGIKPRSPALQADSFPAEPQGKPKNTGLNSLSLFKGICPSQESNQDLLHCRQILYQLSYQGSPSRIGTSLLEPIQWDLLVELIIIITLSSNCAKDYEKYFLATSLCFCP